MLAQARLRLQHSGLVPLVFDEKRTRNDGTLVIGGDVHYYATQRRRDDAVYDKVMEQLRIKMAGDKGFRTRARWMPGGMQVVGVRPDGQIELRQGSQEIVNARWTKEWRDGETDRGEFRLLPHAEAIAQEEGRWAKAVEILRAVKAAGYHVPADAPDYKKRGLVAASEVVTEGHYVMSPDGKEWREAILECPDDVADHANVRVVKFYPLLNNTTVRNVKEIYGYGNLGAVLWLRG